MGYKVPQKVYNLKFADDDEYARVEAKLKGVGMGKLLKIGKLVTTRPEDMVDVLENEVLRDFAAALISWNLEDEEGNPIPATLESLLDEDLLPPSLVFSLVSNWVEIMGNVAAPLKNSSTSGSTSQVASLPMEV